MRQNRVHLMPPMSNFYARICVKATPSSNKWVPLFARLLPVMSLATDNFDAERRCFAFDPIDQAVVLIDTAAP